MPASQTYSFSVILTSTSAGHETYASLDEMPPILRATCLRTLESNNAATLLIADSAGQRALQEMMDYTVPVPPRLPARRPARRLRWLILAVSAACLTLGIAGLWALR